MKAPALLALLCAGRLLAEDARVTALIQQGDVADARQQPQAALIALRQAEAIEPQNFGVVLRISKCSGDLMDRSQDKAAALALGERALEYGRRAVALDQRSAKAHLNLAVCYGKLAEHVSNRTRMEYARSIHESVERSLALDPTDDFGWHVYGRWHFAVANLNGVLKAIGGFMYGGLPEATNEEAERCFRKAIALAPQRLMHHAELARVYATMQKSERAAQAWQNVLGIRAVGPVDAQYQKEARLALESARLPRNSGGRGVARR